MWTCIVRVTGIMYRFLLSGIPLRQRGGDQRVELPRFVQTKHLLDGRSVCHALSLVCSPLYRVLCEQTSRKVSFHNIKSEK
jgi:hypothetical protein